MCLRVRESLLWVAFIAAAERSVHISNRWISGPDDHRRNLLRSSWFDGYHERTGDFLAKTKDSLRERNVFDTLREDSMACFGRWDFEPADLSISEESRIHIWHGKEEKVVPFQLQRCILQKQPLINYHKIPQGGHIIVHYDGICDSILHSLLLREEQQKAV